MHSIRRLIRLNWFSRLKVSAIGRVKKVFGGHHQLGLAPDILEEAGHAARHLKKHGLAQHGTGMHRFKSLSFQF